MHIVDSQVHIWGADSPGRPWPADGAQRAQKPYPVTRDMLLAEMDAAGNIKPSRDRSSEKIDGVAAWCDALYVWMGQEPPEDEGSVYDADPRRILI